MLGLRELKTVSTNWNTALALDYSMESPGVVNFSLDRDGNARDF